MRHQVWEIKRVRASVTEHQFYTCQCSGCGQSTSQPHLVQVPTGNFGPQLVATLATLHERYRITTREVSEIAQDLWQVDISLGAVADGCHKASLALAPSYAPAHIQVQKSQQANVDETGIKGQLEQGQTNPDKKVVTFSREVLKLEERLWVFVNVPGIEPTNNAAERALRPAVIWRKTSFGTQSENGQRFVKRVLSVEATCQLAGWNFLNFLADSLAAQWYNQPMPILFEG